VRNPAVVSGSVRGGSNQDTHRRWLALSDSDTRTSKRDTARIQFGHWWATVGPVGTLRLWSVHRGPAEAAMRGLREMVAIRVPDPAASVRPSLVWKSTHRDLLATCVEIHTVLRLH
jgi:hypothetical protein